MRQTAKPGSKRDSLTGKRLPKIRDSDCVNVFTETLRMNKAITCLLEDKMLHEFPQLREKYGMKTDEAAVFDRDIESGASGPVLAWERNGQIYPGYDINPHVEVERRCSVWFRSQDVPAFLKQMESCKSVAASMSIEQLEMCRDLVKAVVGNEQMDAVTGDIRLVCDHYPVYEENKQWLKEAVVRLFENVLKEVEAAQKDPAKLHEIQAVVDSVRKTVKKVTEAEKALEFPDEWKRPDIAMMKAKQKAATA